MTANAGWAALQIYPSMKGFEGRVSRETGPALSRVGTSGGEHFGTGFSTKASHVMREKFKETAKYVIGPLIGAFAVEKVGEFIGESIKSASDLAAAQNRTNLIFGKSAEEVDHFAEHASKSYGLSALAATSAATQFGIVFKSAKANREESAKGSVRLTKLAADLAAFGHTDVASAATALQKGLQGSTRGLKQYGVLLDSNSIKAEALHLGLLKPVKDQAKIHAAQVAVLKDQAAYNDAVTKNGKGSLEAQEAQAKLGTAQSTLGKDLAGTVPALTAQQKVLAAYPLLLQQTATQQGQFGRSSGDLYNQQQKLHASISNVEDRIGKGLLPIATDFVRFLNQKGVPALDDFSHWFEKKGAPGIQQFVDNAQPFAHSLLPAIGTGFKDVAGFLKDIAPFAKKTIDAFNSLPDWAQKAVVLGGAAAFVGKKTGLLGVGAKAVTGGSSSVFGGIKGTPVDPVWVKVVGGLPGVPGEGGGPKAVPLIDPKTGLRVVRGADAEAAAQKAAQAAFDAVKAAGGGTASASSAAARAFKETLVARDAAVLREAISGVTGFAGKTAAQKIFGGLLGAPGFITSGDSGHEVLPAPTGALTGRRAVLSIAHDTGALPAPEVLKALGVSTALAKKWLGLSGRAINSTEAFKHRLGQAAEGFDLMGRSGIHTYGSIQAKADVYAHTLKSMPTSVRTELDLDVSKANLALDRFRARAGRHINSQMSIELAGNGPSKSSLDGVRRP